METKLNGFEDLTLDEMSQISAGAGLASSISSIAGAVTSGISGLVGAADDVSDIVIKNKIVSKMDEVKKGEIELGKEGSIKLKWDSLTSDNDVAKSTIIF